LLCGAYQTLVDLEDCKMLDLAYIAGSIVFFGVMLAYVRGCAALGRRADTDTGRDA
jgi:hypothetical protein